MMRFLSLLFFFLLSSTCFFSTSPTSHYLIGRFQVGFMRAKLISVSKFREQEKEEKKENIVEWIVLVSSLVSGS